MCLYTSIVEIVSQMFQKKQTRSKRKQNKYTLDDNPILHVVEKAMMNPSKTEYYND